jgi:hypothetical protein
MTWSSGESGPASVSVQALTPSNCAKTPLRDTFAGNVVRAEGTEDTILPFSINRFLAQPSLCSFEFNTFDEKQRLKCT